jgi:UDP-glucose 4-epimerase
MYKKVLVTGGAGFIGSNLVDELICQDIEVVIIDDLSTGKSDNINPTATFIQEDIYSVDLNVLIEIFKDVDVVFHLAALARVQPSIDNPLDYNNINVSGTLKLLFAAHKSNVKRFVYSSSSSVYGDTNSFPTHEMSKLDPLSPYGMQKLIGEQYCSLFSNIYNLDTVCLRYFNVYGERMSLDGAYCLVTGIFARQMLNNQSLTITNDGEQKRDFTYVKDVVNANILAASHPSQLNGEVFNIGNGENVTINAVADMFGGKKVYGEKRLEPFETLADNSKARQILKWEPKGNLSKWIDNYKKELGL